MISLKCSFCIFIYLWNAATPADMTRLCIIEQQIKDHHSHLKVTNLEDIALTMEHNTTTNIVGKLPKTPPYLRIASLKFIKFETVNLEIKSSLVPSCACGNGCRVNLKSSQLLQELFGIKSSITRSSYHVSYGTIHCLYKSDTMNKIDAKGLYENLKALLKTFLAKLQKQ